MMKGLWLANWGLYHEGVMIWKCGFEQNGVKIRKQRFGTEMAEGW